MKTKPDEVLYNDIKDVIYKYTGSYDLKLTDDVYKMILENKILEIRNMLDDVLFKKLEKCLSLYQWSSRSKDYNNRILFEKNGDLIVKKNIPVDLYEKKMEEYCEKKNKNIDLINFLNNNEDIGNVNERIEDKIETIYSLLEKNQVVLIQGNTGCGKTTKIPRLLLNKYKRIVCTQPRRIAAISVAKRVSEELNTRLGDLVGYSVRFSDVSSKNTKLLYMTDGMLIADIHFDKYLNKYDCIVIDEAHERTLNIDILIGYCRMLLKHRNDLRIVIMSATLSSEKFINFFQCPFIDIRHKIYPLDIYFIKSYTTENYFIETIKTIIQLHKAEPKGDILVFLTGQEEINIAFEMLTSYLKCDEAIILKIYGSLPLDEQEYIFESYHQRKIVLATNICETSLTIENIVYVIDSGRVKKLKYSQSLGMDILSVVPISKAQAKQRAGRAGRTQPGRVFRIYTKEEYDDMADSIVPDILTTNISNSILALKSIGINSLNDFDMIDKPSINMVNNALEHLYMLKTIDYTGQITRLGSYICKIPLDPKLSVSILMAQRLGCFDDVVVISALLTVEQIWYEFSKTDKRYKQLIEVKNRFYDDRGDFHVLYNIYRSWQKTSFSKKWLKKNFLNVRNLFQTKKIIEQIRRIFRKDNDSIESNPRLIVEAFSAGFFMNSAKISGAGTYITLFGECECAIHNTSVLYRKNEKYVLYFTLLKTKKEYMKYCAGVTSKTLLKYANMEVLKH